MKKLTSKTALVATVAGLAVAGGGAALAGSQTDSPGSSFLDSVAKHLGISSERLEDATKAAAIDQVNEALRAGKLTQEQADELKSRIESGDFPGFLAPGFFGFREHAPDFGPDGHHLFFGDKLSSAAQYLGLTEAELREQLENGKSLADVAKAKGKSVEGLKDTILAGAKADLDEAVADERLTREQADAIYERLESSIDEIVNVAFKKRGELHFRGPVPPPGFFVPPMDDSDNDWDAAA
jgi:hypothetical protein